MGNIESMMRTFVTSDSEGISRCLDTLRGIFTGHRCCMVTGRLCPLASRSEAISSSSEKSPSPTIWSTVYFPFQPNGTMIGCLKIPSGTVPSVSPAWTVAPG